MAKADHEIAAALGVPVAAILNMRTGPAAILTPGEHWTEVEAGRVAFTAAGLAVLRAHLAPEKKEGAPPAAQPAGPGPEQRLRIVLLFPNPTGVAVRAPNNERIAVRVRNNARLRTGMLLRCRMWEDGRCECSEPSQAVPLKPLAH